MTDANAKTVRKLLQERDIIRRELKEMTRRRDAWKARAEEYPKLQVAVRQYRDNRGDSSVSLTKAMLIAALYETERERDALRDKVEALEAEAEQLRQQVNGAKLVFNSAVHDDKGWAKLPSGVVMAQCKADQRDRH